MLYFESAIGKLPSGANNDFINNLTSDQFAKVRQFFETIPSMKKEIEYTCPNCGRVHKKTLEGLQSFFG